MTPDEFHKMLARWDAEATARGPLEMGPESLAELTRLHVMHTAAQSKRHQPKAGEPHTQEASHDR